MLLITPADFTSFQFFRQLEFKYVKSVVESSLLFLEGLWQFKLCTTKTKTVCAGNCAEEVLLFFLFIVKIPYLHCPLMHLSHALTMSHEEV
jgi:hypothetical protein